MYKRFVNWLDWHKLAMIAAGILILSLLPILYLSFFNYATGDDLGYGAALHQVIVHDGSISEMIAAVTGNVRRSYYSFQGTWSSILLFSLEPSVWGEHFYMITTWIALFCLLFCQGCFLYELIVRRAGFKWHVFLFMYSVTAFLQIQYMPYHRSGLFWYTGISHYVIPYGACMIGLTWVLRFITTGRKRYYVGCLIVMTYLGGAGYPEIVLAMMSFMIVFAAAAVRLIRDRKTGKGSLKDHVKKERSDTKRFYDFSRVIWLVIPFLALMIGFLISAKAPGNKIRGGADFGFDMGNVILTIGKSLMAGAVETWHTLHTVRPLAFFVILIAICTWETLPISGVFDDQKHSILMIFTLYLIFSAIHTPELYVGDDVGAGISGGVYNSYFFVLTVCMLLGTIVITGMLKTAIAQKLGKEHWLISTETGFVQENTLYARRIRIPCILFITGLCLFLHPFLIGNTTDYVAMEYIRSGQFADYRKQMKDRLAILEDPSIQDAVLDPMNDWQGPLMHFPVGEDPSSFVNMATADFYGKHSVTVRLE